MYTNEILQVNYFPDGNETYDSSSVVAINPDGSMIVTEDSDYLFVYTGATYLVISKFPVRISLMDNGKTKFSVTSGIYRCIHYSGEVQFATLKKKFETTFTKAILKTIQKK